MQPNDLVYLQADGHRINTYRIMFIDGPLAFLTPTRKNGEDRTLGQIARFCKWVRLANLRPWQPA